MFGVFTQMFGVCEFGQQLSGAFEEINDVYDQFVWYKFPCKVQQVLPTLIMIAQQPVELHVFGSISCDRITLKNVSKIFIFYEKKTKIQSIFFTFT